MKMREKGRVHSAEMKTLKDFEGIHLINTKQKEFVASSDLREEAKKYVEYYEEWLENHDLDVNETQHVIKWIKDFFNLEEKDE